MLSWHCCRLFVLAIVVNASLDCLVGLFVLYSYRKLRFYIFWFFFFFFPLFLKLLITKCPVSWKQLRNLNWRDENLDGSSEGKCPASSLENWMQWTKQKIHNLMPWFRLKLLTLSRVCICLKVDQFLAKTLLTESLTDISGICFVSFFVSLVEAKAEGLKGGEHLVSSSVKPVFWYLFWIALIFL